MDIGFISWEPQAVYYRIELTYRQYRKYCYLSDYHGLTQAAAYAVKVGHSLVGDSKVVKEGG